MPDLDKYHGQDIFLTEALTLEAKSEIDQALARKKPFFLHMSHYAVHSPFHSDPRFAKNYRDSDKGKPAQAYATLIEGMDKSLGDLMDHVEAKGVAENTLFIFLGDNGGDCPHGPLDGISSSAPLRGRKGRQVGRRPACPLHHLVGQTQPEQPLAKETPHPRQLHPPGDWNLLRPLPHPRQLRRCTYSEEPSH